MKNKTLILFGFILAKFIIQYSLISPDYELHRDEYLHLDQGRHLAWGYFSVPPVTSWISYIILLLGNGVFWIKFFPALFGALTLLVVWKTIEELSGGLFALCLGTLSVLLSAILRINILYQPNSLDILLWTLVYFTIIKYINSGNYKWLYIAAVTFALGFLNKYSIVFLFLCLLPAILLTAQRIIFFKKHIFFAVALGLLIISPNLIWQYNNNFPVFHHLEELTKTQLVNGSRTDFLKEQIIFFFGSILVVAAALISFIIYLPFKKYRLFFWSFLFTLSLLAYFRAKGYYAIGLYPFLLAFGSVYIEQLLKERWTIYLRPVAIALPILIFIPLFRIAFPNNSPDYIQQNAQRYKDLNLLRWEDGKDHSLPQDFADMLGWKELAQKVDSAYASIADKDHTLVLCDNYGQAGAINYYSKNKNIQAVSFNADYINWFPLSRQLLHVVLIKEEGDTDKNREKEKQLFTTVMQFDQINNPFAREKNTNIYILKNASFDLNKRIREELEKKKNEH